MRLPRTIVLFFVFFYFGFLFAVLGSNCLIVNEATATAQIVRDTKVELTRPMGRGTITRGQALLGARHILAEAYVVHGSPAERLEEIYWIRQRAAPFQRSWSLTSQEVMGETDSWISLLLTTGTEADTEYGWLECESPTLQGAAQAPEINLANFGFTYEPRHSHNVNLERP